MGKTELNKNWKPQGYSNLDILQQPKWPNLKAYNQVIDKLLTSPPLVLPYEIIKLKKRLKKVAIGKTFLLQGGDCAETFKDFSEKNIKNKLKILFQMSTIISYGSSIDVLKIGRMAGQYAKPRSSNLETRQGITLPSYRGDSINDIEFNFKSRTPNPDRLIKAFNQSLATFNLINILIRNEFNDLDYFSLKGFNKSRIYNRFEKTINRIDKSLKFVNVLNNDIDLFEQKGFNEFYISHESLILDYESALTKKIENNRYYNTSTHMLWLGDRTRSIKSAHVEYLSKIINPIGIKCGPNLDVNDLKLIIQKINPTNEEGKIILICRFGVNRVKNQLLKLINMIEKECLNVIWVCDPMHGNTYQSNNKYKTRNFKTIINELKLFFDIHYNHPTIIGGIHFEFTPNNVTECLGGIRNIKESDLHIKYETACDPRLNHEQSIELAFMIADLIEKYKG